MGILETLTRAVKVRVSDPGLLKAPARGLGGQAQGSVFFRCEILRLPGVQAAAAAGGGSATPGSRAAAPHGGESRAGRQRWGRPRAETPATRLRNPRAASRAQRSAQACRGARRGPRGQRETPRSWTPPAPQVCVLGLSTCCRCRGDRAPGPFPGLPKSPSVLRVKRRSVLWSSGKSF